MCDLRTKYNDGTYDIIDLYGGYGSSEMGISFLVKRQFPVRQTPIDQVCGSLSVPKEIEERELAWFESKIEENSGKNKIANIKIERIQMNKNFPYGRVKRNYLE